MTAFRVCVHAWNHDVHAITNGRQTQFGTLRAGKLIFASGRRAYKYSKVGTFGRLVWLIGSPAESPCPFSLSERFRFSAHRGLHTHKLDNVRGESSRKTHERNLAGMMAATLTVAISAANRVTEII